MKRVIRHLRVSAVVVLAVLIGGFPMYTSAAAAPVLTTVDTPSVFITEFQTNGGSASQEFIELYNATDHEIDFSDDATNSAQWKLQFFNSTSVKTGAPTWATSATASNSITLMGKIPAHDYFILGSTGYAPAGLEADQTYSASSSHLMTDTGGGLQLLQVSGTDTPDFTMVHDRVMWLAPANGTSLPAGVLVTPTSGKSLQRLPNDDLEYIEADASLTGYGPSDNISPLDAWQAPVPVVPDTTPATDTDDLDESETLPSETSAGGSMFIADGPIDNIGLAVPRITELLPNPASPKTDAADEFIELYNPNNAPFDLKGYVLEVGTSTLHDFNITDNAIMPAYAYVAFYAADTRLSLTNSGGQARLLDPAKEKINETASYTAAADDSSWNLVEGTWQWSATPTPNAENMITSTPDLVKAAATAKAATAGKATKASAAKTTSAKAKGNTTTKKAAAKKAVAKKKTTKKKAAVKKTAVVSAAATTKPKPPIHTGVLVAVAVAALLYGLYEYRHDISNKFAQLRGNRGTRRGNRGQTEWRRGYSTE